MDFMQFDMHLVRRALLVIWVVLGGPVIMTLVPLKVVDPWRRFLYSISRRGKLLQSSDPTGRGLLRFTVPQSFFTHFYMVGLLVNTILFFTAFGFAGKCSESVKHQFSSVLAQLIGAGEHHTLFTGHPVAVLGEFGRDAWRLVFLLLLFEIHLIRRLYECLFVSEFHPEARMNFIGYLVALGFYVQVPLTLFSQAFSQESFGNSFIVFLSQRWKQGQVQMVESVADKLDVLDVISCLGSVGWMPYMGAALCFYGAYHQYTCHEILAALRAQDKPRTEKKYYIPRGDWFELVSSPHYLAEIIIYVGFLVASGGTSLSMYLMLGLVVANLSVIGTATHEWYLAKFDDYPKSRCAMIPYVC